MSPTWFFMEECAEWQGDASMDSALKIGVSALRQPSWDWLTIAVYVCPQSCVPLNSSGWICVEEAAKAFHGAECVLLPGARVQRQVQIGTAASSSELSGG
jgi:hypothetical protein